MSSLNYAHTTISATLSSCKLIETFETETYLLDRVTEGLDNLLVLELEIRDVLEVLRERLARDRQLTAIDQVRVLEEVLEQSGNTTRLVQVLHNELSRWPADIIRLASRLGSPLMIVHMELWSDALNTYFKSHKYGVLSATRWKSSIVSSTSAARAIARKWRTELVDPPRALTIAIAFRKDWRVRISLTMESKLY